MYTVDRLRPIWSTPSPTGVSERDGNRQRCSGPGHIVLDGDPAPPPRKAAQQPPLFGPLCSGTIAHLNNC